MAVGNIGSSLESAVSLIHSGGAMLQDAVSAGAAGNLEDAVAGMILSKQAVKAGAVLARVSDEAMQATIDMIA